MRTTRKERKEIRKRGDEIQTKRKKLVHSPLSYFFWAVRGDMRSAKGSDACPEAAWLSLMTAPAARFSARSRAALIRIKSMKKRRLRERGMRKKTKKARKERKRGKKRIQEKRKRKRGVLGV